MRLGGIVAILYGSILLFNFLSTPQVGPQTNTLTNILEEFIGGIIDGWDRFARAGYPLSGLTNLIYILLTLAFALHVFWLLICGGVEIVRTSKGERAIFGEPLQGLSLKSKILSRVFGLPTLLDFIRGSPGRYTLIVLLPAITAICMTGGLLSSCPCLGQQPLPYLTITILAAALMSSLTIAVAGLPMPLSCR